MTIEEMKSRKREMGLSNREIAERSGVPLGTVQKIFGGITSAPRMETIIALEKILQPVNDRMDPGMRSFREKDTLPRFLRREQESYVSEPMPAYMADILQRRMKRQGEFTIEDLGILPDDIRVELIDGAIYYMAAPSLEHQLVLGEVFAQLRNYIRENKGKCRTFTSPFDVQLDRDDRTLVQPDILIMCDKSLSDGHGCFGAPDLVIEVLSPSTAVKDLTIKLRKYLSAGVREYWTIDMENRQIAVYKKQGAGAILQTYTFADQVPVGIWEDKCLIDFPDIDAQLKEWTGEEER